MRAQITGGAVAIVLLVAGIVAWMSLYTVPQTQFALPLRLGQARDPRTEPGLYAKVPFIDNIVFVDKRILSLDSPSQEVIASDQKRLVVDAFMRYRVTDPLRFYQTLNSVDGAEPRLANLVNSAVRRVLGQATFSDVVRDRRAILMGQIRDEVNAEAKNYGVAVADVRIRGADLPEANSQAVFQRMQTERQRQAAQFRAQGSEAAQRIRAQADRDVARVTGEANGQAERIRGAADAQRSRVFADAYGRDPDFYAFFRSLQSYQSSLRASNTRLVLSPDAEFFRFMRQPNAKLDSGPGSPLAAPQPAQSPPPTP